MRIVENLNNLSLLKLAGKQTKFTVSVTAREGQQFTLDDSTVTIEHKKIGVSIAKPEGYIGNYSLFLNTYRMLEIQSKLKKSKQSSS